MYQKLTIIGNLGRDPEMRYTPDGTPVTSFQVATNKKWTGQDGQSRQSVVWFKVTAWRRQAETCSEYLQKGRQVYVEGELTADDSGNPAIWEGNDGRARASFEVRAHVVKFLGRPGRDNGDELDAPPAGDPPEEIPF